MLATKKDITHLEKRMDAKISSVKELVWDNFRELLSCDQHQSNVIWKELRKLQDAEYYRDNALRAEYV